MIGWRSYSPVGFDVPQRGTSCFLIRFSHKKTKSRTRGRHGLKQTKNEKGEDRESGTTFFVELKKNE